jgi:Cu(I)/Ag(I) efflux system membrane fusion protein
MSPRLWIAIAAGALCVGLLGGYFLADRSNDGPPAQATTGAAGVQQERKVLYWHDPMVPGARFDKPGKSPFMDMELVPVYADAEGSAAVQIDSTVTQNLGIRLSDVEKRAMEQRVRAVGNVVVDERRIQVVQTRVPGTVTRLHVRSPLVPVKRGQLLAEVVSPEWIGAQQEYLALLDAQSSSSQPIRVAARARLEVLGVPEATIRTIESTRKVSATTSVHSPMDGVITELAIREGAAFAAGSTLFQIANLQSVWIEARIPESQVSAVTRGTNAQVTATAWPGRTFEGRVIALLPKVDPQTRTVGARLEVTNEGERLVPGMYVSVQLADSGGEEQLVVPSEALIMTGERTVVIVARQGGGFDVANVTIGAEADGKTTILSGLTEGQSVVVSGQFLIDSEASLKSTINRIGAEDGNANTAPASPDAMAQPMSSEGTHSARGTIVALNGDQITIAHGPVTSLQWPAMTMGFKRPSSSPSDALKVGDRVSFSFSQSPQGGFQIERIDRGDEEAARQRTEAEKP